MPRSERLRFTVFDSVRIAGRVLVSAPARGSARVTGGVSRPVSEAADLYQDKHTFYSQLSNLDGFKRNFRSDFSGKKSHSFFSSIRGRYHGALEGMHD